MEKLRVDKLLANMGIGTRSEIKKAVKQGKVAIDGKIVKDSGIIVYPDEQKISFDGEEVLYKSLIYLMLNKPPGVISATEDNREQTVIDLLAPSDRLLQPFPVGRLDKDTVGLLLLSNDGQLAHELLSPRKHVDKTYEALVRGKAGQADCVAFRGGVKLDDGYVTLPAELQVLEHTMVEGECYSSIRLTIQEGKFHQVKRMFEAVGKQVVHLKRVAMGPLQLDPEPLKVAALGEANSSLGYADDLRPPGSIGNQPRWPASQPPPSYSQPSYPQSQPAIAPRADYPTSTGAPMSLNAPGVAPPDDEDVAAGAEGTPPPMSRAPYSTQPYPASPPLQSSPPRLGPQGSPVTAFGPVALKPTATLACPIVSMLDRWLVESVQPAAQRWFGARVVEIKQISAYSCRGMNGNPRAHVSEHAFGNALDIAAFTLADGRRI